MAQNIVGKPHSVQLERHVKHPVQLRNVAIMDNGLYANQAPHTTKLAEGSDGWLK